MRKSLFLIAALAAMASSPAHAYTELVNGVEWTYIRNAGEASIVNLSCEAAIPVSTVGAITIPSTLGGCPVTSIGDLAFVACSGLTSVTIPDSVTSIGESAFVACSGLTSVTIPDSVKSIGNYAFAACSNIKSVTIPQCVCSEKLSSSFPSAYQAITNVVISEGVTSIRQQAFEGCTNLASVTIPNSVTRIGYSAFDGCNVALFDRETILGVRLVDGWAVGYDDLAGDLDLTGVRGIGARAFKDCYNLTSVTIPSCVTRIGDGAFYYCDGLTNVIFGSGITSIGEWAFSYCDQLTSVTIPSGVSEIKSLAFYYCSSLTNVIFKGNAPSVDDASFDEVGSGCLASVSRSSTGWNVAEGEKWHGLTLVYVDGGGGEVDSVFEIVDVAIEVDVQGLRHMVVGVVAKDGEQIVQGDASKVAFEATSDLRDWEGAAKLTPTVEELQGNGTTLRFRVTPGDGTATRAFLRIRHQQ